MTPIGNQVVCLLLVAALCPSTVGNDAFANEKEAFESEDLAFFETKIRSVLAEHCYQCHSAASKSIKAGLRVDSRKGLLDGGDSGPAIVPGDANESMLLAAIRYEEYEMPPKGRLPDSVIADFARWLDRSAAWPDEEEPAVSEEPAKVFDLEQRKANHWAWQPLSASEPPTVEHQDGALSDIDCYIFAELSSAGLRPAPPVGRAALARRLSFDLVGLPPSPEEVAEYVNDSSKSATEHYVDRLLDSPQFGERWGRHWLDLVRYAESRGHEFDPDTPHAFQYRDYVIRALNADVPYDQFVKEHIAGDLLPNPRLNTDSGFNESVLGTGFWFLGEWVHSPVDIRKDEADRFDNMIDCMSKTFLGLTVSCARCHDHKFDAISTEDYYSLTGFLQSSHYCEVPFESLERNRQVATSLESLDLEYQAKLDAELRRLIELDSKTESLPWEGNLAPIPELPEGKTHRIVFDYTGDSGSSTSPFFSDGLAYGTRLTRPGQWVVNSQDGTNTADIALIGSARNDPFWNAIETVEDRSVNGRRTSIPPGAGRGMRTPTFELRDGIVSLQVRGQGHVFACVDSHRLIVGPLHGETQKKIAEKTEDSIHWVHLNLARYIGHQVHFELAPEHQSCLELMRVLEASGPVPARNAKADEIYQAAQRWLPELLQRVGDENARPLKQLKLEWIERRQSLVEQVQIRSRLAMAMMDGIGEEGRVFIRGNASAAGPVVPRHFLTAIDPTPFTGTSTSGRLELAKQITDPSNPLYARVIVNRIWHHLLGRGIVPTVDDFGVLGQRPSHPALLDHLAMSFLDDGQSLKRLIRRVVLSRTYQMSNETSLLAEEIDPINSLYHHREPKRLEGEIVRDALLSVSGELNLTMHGESIPVFLTNFMDGRGRPGASGPSDGDRRRSIYIEVRRNFVSPFMLAFDTPVPFSTMGRRTVSNVPAQALILMNDPFVIERAKAWAEHLIQASPNNMNDRIEKLYQAAYSRSPTVSESKVITEYAQSNGFESVQTWADVTHSIFNSKEFIYVP